MIALAVMALALAVIYATWTIEHALEEAARTVADAITDASKP